MIKFKQFDVGDSGYEEEMEKFQIEHPRAEFLQITGGHMSHEQIWFKYDDGAEQTKLSIPRKIAEQADKTDFDELFQLGKEEFYQWFDHEHDKYKEVIYAYLAGKGLGVELVEVSDE
jgi:hypothetical protein